MKRLAATCTIILFACQLHAQINPFDKAIREPEGAYHRSDTAVKSIYLCFTAHELMEGLPFVTKTLRQHQIPASFFLTGDFVRNHPGDTRQLFRKGHYVGAHSDKHLLYCDWTKRDSLLVSLDSIVQDLQDNRDALAALGIPTAQTHIFMPPYEWYNKAVLQRLHQQGITMVNFTGGTSSNADYTTPDMKNYVSSDTIMDRILRYEKTHPTGLNGFHLLIHVGTEPARKDKLYHRLPELITLLKNKGYRFRRFE